MRTKSLLLLLLVLAVLPSFSQDSTDTIGNAADSARFESIDVPAEFPGGFSAWSRFLQSNLDVNVPIRNKAKNGTYRVIIQFVVLRDGSISDIKAITDHGHGMEEEVMRVLQKGPKWNPGMQNGKKVKVLHRQPVTFKVSG